MKVYSALFLVCVAAGSIAFSTSSAFAQQQYAGKQRATISRSHMARARVLLVEALTEFEEARKYARPDLLLDSEDWRLRLISLTEQLNRVIDPTPRVTREGAVFRVPPTFIRRAKHALPDVADGAYSRSDVGELARLKSKQEARAKQYEGTSEPKEPALIPADEEPLPLPEFDDQESGRQDRAGLKRGEQPSGKAPQGDLFTDDLLPEMPATDQAARGEDMDMKSSDDAPAAYAEPARGQAKDLADSAPAEGYSHRGEVEEEDAYNALPTYGESDQGSQGDAAALRRVDELPDLPEYGEDEEQNQKAPAREKNQDMDFGAIPGVISDDEVSEISPEVAAKQLSEDEQLARELERSIDQKLSN